MSGAPLSMNKRRRGDIYPGAGGSWRNIKKLPRNKIKSDIGRVRLPLPTLGGKWIARETRRKADREVHYDIVNVCCELFCLRPEDWLSFHVVTLCSLSLAELN